MENVIIKKEVIKSEKEKFILALPFDSEKKFYLTQKVSEDEIFNFFLSSTSIYQLKYLNFKDINIEKLDDYIPFISNVVKIKIMTAMLNAGIQLELIYETMNIEEQINLLIDLKNLKDVEVLQAMIADTLESKI